MAFIIKSKLDNILKDDALGIGKVASSDPMGINATVGSFQPFEVFDFVKEIEGGLSTKDKYAYSSVDGGEKFRQATNSYLGLSDHYVISTPGGTGAITTSVGLTLEKGETLLIPYPCWGPYFGIAKENGLNVATYTLLKDDKFNLDGFIEVGNKIISEEGKLVFILNDPCHNPTGYSLRQEELEDLVGYLNKQKVPCTMILDCAYLDMSNEARHKDRSFLKLHLEDNVEILYCVSYSKSYQIYGQRLGALVMKDEFFYKVACFHARTTWSNCNHAMITLIEKVELDLETKAKHKMALEKIQNALSERSKLFLSEAKSCNLKTLKYDNGFFISIPCKNNKEVFEKLKDEHIYVLPVCDLVRVAICGLTLEQVKGLAKKIKEYIIE